MYHAFQDSKGYIWFATDNGVSRYDGYEFRNFSQKDGLPDNTVFEIYEDYQNRIWFVPHSAKFSYFKNDSIFEYKYNDQLQKKLQLSSNPNKLSFYIDSLDNLYYGDVYNGGFIVDRYGGTKKIKNFDGIINLLLINNKLILNTLTDNSKSGDNINFIHLISVDTILNKLPNKTRQNRHIGFAKNENVFIATNNFLLHLMEKRLNAKKLKHPILWISEDRENNLWTGTRKGAYKFESFNIDKEPCLHILKNKNITSVLQDSEGGYWFTTLLNGVYYTPAFSVLNFKNDSILSKSVYAISADKKSNWLGLNNKIVKLATLTEKELINLDKDNVIIKDIFHDTNNDKVWIASRFLYSIGKKNVIKHSFKYKSNITTGAQPKGIISKENGEVWLATSIGIFKSSKENFFEPVSNDIKYKIKFNSICLDKTETKIYCWSNDGLWTYQINKKTFKYLGEENVSLSYKIDCIINNNFHNNIWIGTKSNGIILFNGDTTTYNITVEDGLSSNNITSLFQKDSIVWVSTINGLNKIVLNSHENAHDFNITNFSTIHGLSSNEIYDVYANDSIAYLATNKGLNLIRYKDYKSNLNPPGIFIKNIKVLDKDTTIKDYYELAYNQNSVYIEYVGLMYKNNGTKRYKYNFHQSGKKTRWNITTENFLRFSYLPPGNYNLEIIAINEDGVESSNPATLRFKIHPPFWKTYWFIALCLFITITITYLLYYSRLKELRKRNNIEKSLLKEVNIYKQQALGQQMNPHFIFNTLNSIQYFIYENNNESSIHYLSQFAQLMRIVLENSQHETIVIQKEFDALNLYLELESLRFENGFNYHIEIPNEIDTHSYYIYPLLIQPYIENSIWHGLYHKKGTKNLNIELLNKENYILCVIEDNGIGREKSGELNQRRRKKHKSLGTNITNKRIDAINKLYNQNFSVEFVDLKDKLGNPCGTKVLLKIPKITD